MPKKKALKRLQLLPNPLDRKGSESVASVPDDVVKFVADGFELLQRIRRQKARSKLVSDFDDEAA